MILIAGVGYSHLTDLSFGPLLVEHLRKRDWPADVQIEDLSYGPIAVLQWFQDHPGRFEQMIAVGAIQRHGFEPGTLRSYRWETGRFDQTEIQERVTEAVTGIVSLENLLAILEHFEVLPSDTLVIEFEPVKTEWGLDLSQTGERRLIEVRDVIEREVLYTRQTTGLN
jgi:hydrogenase maturation protease